MVERDGIERTKEELIDMRKGTRQKVGKATGEIADGMRSPDCDGWTARPRRDRFSVEFFVCRSFPVLLPFLRASFLSCLYLYVMLMCRAMPCS